MSKDQPTSEKTLLERSQNGDLAAFDSLVLAHGDWLRGMLRSRLQDWTAADDIAQEAFVTAFRKIRSFRGEASFETWLRAIALNHLRNYIRKRRERPVGGLEQLHLLVSFDDHSPDTPEQGVALDALKICLEKVDGASRKLLVDRYVTGKTAREMSIESGKVYSSLTMQLHRIRKSLGDCVKKNMEASPS